MINLFLRIWNGLTKIGPSDETEAFEFNANGGRIELGIPVTTATRCQTDFLLLPDGQMICGQNSGEHCE